MLGLSGDLSVMPLKDLVVYLGNRRSSGRLEVEHEGVKKKVEIHDGLVTNASSNQPREYLGQFLINLGHLTEDDFNKAYETQRQTKVFLGKILSMIGLVSEEVVLSALNLKFRETVLDALGWRSGTFTFDVGVHDPSVDGLEVQIDLLELHRESEFREAAWRTLREVFPNGQVRLELSEANLPEPPAPGSFEEKLAYLIGEGFTIDDMALALHASDFGLYQRLYALYKLNAVKVLPARPPKILPTEPTTPPEEAPRLVRQSSASLEELRRNLADGNRVPTLLLAPAMLRNLELTAPERYLLSRVDGRRTVAAIVRVSPIHELDALNYFQGFVESGLIKIT